MYVTTVIVVLLIGWCGLTILTQPAMQRLPPAPKRGISDRFAFWKREL
jgi:hypothetical protein